MTWHDHNRFQDRADIPPPAWTIGTLRYVVPYPKGGPSHAIFVYSYEFMGQEYRAGRITAARYDNDVFYQMVVALMGKGPKLGARVWSSQLLGKRMMILPQATYSSQLGLWYIRVDEFKPLPKEVPG